MADIQIDKEFHSLIPPLSKEEYKLLEDSIVKEGCREALVLWNNTIVDGHNRFEICNRQKVKYRTIGMKFEDRNAAKVWIIDNQNGRRNLTDGWKYKLKETRREILAEMGKEKQKEHGKTAPGRKSLLSVSDKSVKHNTQKAIAEELGWSTGKVAKADYVNKKAGVKIKEDFLSGRETVDSAYKKTKKEETVVRRKKEAEVGKSIILSDSIDLRLGDFKKVLADIKKVDLILTDPPYGEKYLPLWEDLAVFAEEKLKENGYLVAYSGQAHLSEVLNMLRNHLRYIWTFCLYHRGNTQIVNSVNVICRWKPILIFQKGKKKFQETIQDYVESEISEKDKHNWQQGLSAIKKLMEVFSRTGDIICDPFSGGGTIALACKETKRRFIGVEIEEETFNISKERLNDLCKTR